MEKSSSVIRALVCAALLLVVLFSLFLPVVTFNSADRFEGSLYKMGYYSVDLRHAGKVKVSLTSALFSSGKDVNTMVKLYKLEMQKQDSALDALKTAEIQAQIDEIMGGISDKQDAKIQEKLQNKSFLKKIALRAAMYNSKKDSSYLTFALVLTALALAVLILDVVLKLVKLVKSGFEINCCTLKALTNMSLPIIAFILHMFTVQHYVAKTRGVVSLGAGIVIGLVAIIAFAAVRGIVPVLEAKAEGADKFKKTVIKQSITAGVLLITVIIALLGMRMSALMIYDMESHYPEFQARYLSLITKGNPLDSVDKIAGSMSIVVSIIAAIPLLPYAALGYMLARTGMVEKVSLKKKREQKSPLGSFYIGFVFVAVAYVLSLVLFCVEDSKKRYEMYSNCQMSVVFTEYKDEGSAENIAYNTLSEYKDTLKELKEEYKNQYKDASDKETKAEIKSDLEDLNIELKAVDKKMDRIESRKKSNVIFIITLAAVAVAAEVVFKMTKFEAEKLAASGKEN